MISSPSLARPARRQPARTARGRGGRRPAMALRRWLRVSLFVALALLIAVVGALLLLPRWIDTPAMHAYITQLAGQAVGRPVKFTSLAVSFLPLPSVILKGLQVA